MMRLLPIWKTRPSCICSKCTCDRPVEFIAGLLRDLSSWKPLSYQGADGLQQELSWGLHLAERRSVIIGMQWCDISSA